MSVFIKHEPCPKCRAKGADRHGDNLGRYKDGSAWCFACGHREGTNGFSFNPRKEDENDSQLQLPEDLCLDYPRHVVSWLARYGITVEEGMKHGWKYSPKWDQLLFIFYDAEGNPTCSQARNFYERANKKYYNEGDTDSLLPIFHGSASMDTGKLVVVVEDVLSAAKIGRQFDAMPCLGSHLKLTKINALRLLGYEHLVMWLDADKWKEACLIADRAKLIGFTTKVVYTDLDPKEYSNEDICQFVSK